MSTKFEEHQEVLKTNPLAPINTEGIVDELVQKAKHEWAMNEPSRDDITAILVFLI